MGIFDLFQVPDLNRELEDFHSTPGALLLDVRSPGEYRLGHIPGSENVPLNRLELLEEMAESKEIPLFVYCQSGSRSRQAVSLLSRMGYANAKNIGGITGYAGPVAK